MERLPFKTVGEGFIKALKFEKYHFGELDYM